MPVGLKNVDLVHVFTSDGVRLDGAHLKAQRPGASKLPVDVFIMNHGVAGSFYQRGTYDDFAPWMAAQGCAAIRINNRGHDFISPAIVNEKRVSLGAAYEIIDDCRKDWDAWISFAQESGYSSIGIWGHSLGGVKTIYFCDVDKDPRVRVAIASSPPRFSYSYYTSVDEWEGHEDVGKLYKETCEKALRQVAEGTGNELMLVEYPRPLLVSANTYLDKYGPEEKYDIVKHIPGVPVPLLVTIGTLEPHHELPFFGLPEELQRLAGELESFTFEYVEGANHAYTDHRQVVWDLLLTWLKSL